MYSIECTSVYRVFLCAQIQPEQTFAIWPWDSLSWLYYLREGVKSCYKQRWPQSWPQSTAIPRVTEGTWSCNLLFSSSECHVTTVAKHLWNLVIKICIPFCCMLLKCPWCICEKRIGYINHLIIHLYLTRNSRDQERATSPSAMSQKSPKNSLEKAKLQMFKWNAREIKFWNLYWVLSLNKHLKVSETS